MGTEHTQIQQALSGLRDNYSRGTAGEFLGGKVRERSVLSIVSAYFTIYAYDALMPSLERIKHLDFLFGEPSFVNRLDPDKTEKKAFLIDDEALRRLALPDTDIWKALFSFQKDGAKAAINKILNYNGCILADSVGLGKTYTALVVIKYFELRNERVLVLCPKKLRRNGTVYRANSTLNPFADDLEPSSEPKCCPAYCGSFTSR